MNAHQRGEEVLEYIWTLNEGVGEIKRSSVDERFGEATSSDLLEKVHSEGFVSIENGDISLTADGTRHAELVVRRHRLAERLMHDVLEYSSGEYESSACQFEHYVGDDVVRSICILLGHPESCPHGCIIPRGDCCRTTESEVSTLVTPITEMKTGDVGRVIYITTSFQHRLDRISGIGIMPGARISVLQRIPTFVIRVGESQVALDHNIASGIYVRSQH